jgi:hypothetical protein
MANWQLASKDGAAVNLAGHRVRDVVAQTKMKIFRLFVLASTLLFSHQAIAEQTQTSSDPELPVSGPAVWKIAGVEYQIDGTALVVMGNGQGLFIVKAQCDFPPDASHRGIAKSIAQYAVDHGLQKKAGQVLWNGKPVPFSGAVGVALAQQQSAILITAPNGFRYTFLLGELQKE